MKRRSFIHLSTLGVATSLILPNTLLAAPASMAGGLYYTKEAPGRWAKKVGGHLPLISSSKGNSGTDIEVVTAHEMNEYEHYIVKHIILTENFEFIAEKIFDPRKDKAPISHFSLGDYRGQIHALSVCNKHDTWLSTADI